MCVKTRCWVHICFLFSVCKYITLLGQRMVGFRYQRSLGIPSSVFFFCLFVFPLFFSACKSSVITCTTGEFHTFTDGAFLCWYKAFYYSQWVSVQAFLDVVPLKLVFYFFRNLCLQGSRQTLSILITSSLTISDKVAIYQTGCRKFRCCFSELILIASERLLCCQAPALQCVAEYALSWPLVVREICEV